VARADVDVRRVCLAECWEEEFQGAVFPHARWRDGQVEDGAEVVRGDERGCVPPKACLGAEAAMGTMRVGLRCEYGRVPPGGQERPRGESGRDEIISRGTGEEKAVVRRMGRRARSFIVEYGW
jgi:hypothetical protein